MQSVVVRVEQEHQELDELLLQHQMAVIERNWTDARYQFARFAQGLINHIEFENNELLSIHEREVTEPRWPTRVYRLEHEKILALVDKLADLLAKTPPTSREAEIRWAIYLLDEEKTLKGVLEHHEEREEKGLLPELLWLSRSLISEETGLD